MKILKRIGVALLAIIVLLFVVSLFLPAKRDMVSTIIIKAPVWSVFEEVNILKNWSKWSPWEKTDTTMVTTYEGNAMGVGAIMKWTSESGDGALTIVESVENQKIKNKLEFTGAPMETFGEWIFEESDEGTKVTWSFTTDVGFNPIARYMIMFMKKEISNSQHEGLGALSEICEAKPTKKEVETDVTVKEIAAQKYVTIREVFTDMDAIGDKMGIIIGELMQFLGKNQIPHMGPPISIYYNYSSDTIDMATGMPVANDVEVEGRIRMYEINAGSAACLTHWGAYDLLGMSYEKIQSWIIENNKQIIGPTWEVYITDPQAETDTSKWQTDIYFPILK